MNLLRRMDRAIAAAGRAFLSRDRTAGSAGVFNRTPAEMAAWRELPDPKPSYEDFVGIPPARRTPS